jgi:hypothetical protein
MVKRAPSRIPIPVMMPVTLLLKYGQMTRKMKLLLLDPRLLVYHTSGHRSCVRVCGIKILP